jgi:UDP-glucuronate decarboxylase
MLELANAVIDLTGSRSKVVHRPLPEDDPRQRRPNIPKTQESLGWKLRTPLKDGLAKTIAYFETLLQVPHVRDMLDLGK